MPRRCGVAPPLMPFMPTVCAVKTRSVVSRDACSPEFNVEQHVSYYTQLFSDIVLLTRPRKAEERRCMLFKTLDPRPRCSVAP